jgi:YtkA-like
MRQHPTETGENTMASRRLALPGCVVLAFAVMAMGCGGAGDPANMTELQRLKSGTIDVVVLSPGESLKHGKDTFLIEFRSTSDGSLTDVGDVRASATMPMPGMPMFGSIDVQRTDVAGRYQASGEFSMAGAWRMTIEWNGTNGRSSVAFTGTVQ